MKTFTTSQAQDFTIDYASAISAGFGHKRITVDVIAENGDKKEFEATSNNMPAYDEADELEGQEKYEALFEMVESALDDQIAEWISDLN